MMKSIALSESSCLCSSTTTTAEEDFVIVEPPPILTCQMKSLKQVARCEKEYDDESSYDYCEDVYSALDETDFLSSENKNNSMTSQFFVSQIEEESTRELSTTLSFPRHYSSLSQITINTDTPLPTATTTFSEQNNFPTPTTLLGHQTSEDSIGKSPLSTASHSPKNLGASPKNSSSIITTADDDDDENGQSVVDHNHIPTKPQTNTTTTTTRLTFKRISNKKRRKQIKLAKKEASGCHTATIKRSQIAGCCHHQA